MHNTRMDFGLIVWTHINELYPWIGIPINEHVVECLSSSGQVVGEIMKMPCSIITS